ncbi:interleukin-12 subunit beta [Eublepharis macularius]|uniref:Interleukin-12 subunit beta n=1 Tax=Eublepharis macularius TaxID=481883 RepID=A0AA97J749_EUBMA|nr:interleukin-12 subunit beta [Eublepharis macularius]
MAFWSFILISVLCFAAHSEAKWKLKDNVYIIDSEWTADAQHETITLQCNVSGNHNNTSVYWKKDNKRGRHGANWEIKVREPRDAGNFTCWSSKNHELLSYTTLYVAKKIPIGEILENNESNNSSNFRCTAKNYSGIFTCSWMRNSESQPQSTKFAVRSLNIDTSESITCEEPIRDSATSQRYSVSCKKERSCESAEEYQQISMVVDAFDEHLYENDTHSFFIRDILKPDVIECETRRIGSSRFLVTWNPPQTWSKPLSYFGLSYQIKTDEETCAVDNPVPQENGSTVGCHIKTRGDKIYIQSKDGYNKNSSWSEWSKPCRTMAGNIPVVYEGEVEEEVAIILCFLKRKV